MVKNGQEELARLCEEADLVRMLPDGDEVLLEICAWSAVICEIRLLGVRNTDRKMQNVQDFQEACFFELPPDGCYTELRAFTVLEDGYRLSFYNMNAEEDQEICFARIEYRCEPCNALCERIESYTRLQNPWEYLGLVARGICCHIEYDVANETELEISALAEFLEILQGDWETQKLPQADWADEMMQIPGIFWDCAAECGISAVIEQYASSYGKLFRELSKEKYEPFWRKLYYLLAATQEGIPSHAQRCCRKEDLQEHREYVSRCLKEQGFEGEYPSFHAKGILKKPSLFFSYENTHFAFQEKEAESFIFCCQQDQDGEIETELFCGVKFHPQKEDDFFSCMFDSHGKSYFSCLTTKNAINNHGNFAANDEAVPECDDRKSVIDWESCGRVCVAAAKSAGLCHLTKTEYAYKHTASVWNSRGYYITYFLASLVMFGFLMTAGFAAIEVVLAFLFTQSAAEVAECVRVTPWGIVFAAAGILYAAPMTICMYRAMRK